MKTVVMDTSAYNKIVDIGKEHVIRNAITADIIKILQTHIEEDQISATSNEEKRSKMQVIETVSIPTNSFVLGTSKLGRAEMGSINLDELRKHNSQNVKKTKDALIAEVALQADIFVSDDKQQRHRFLSQNPPGKLMYHDEFIKWLEDEV